MTRTTGVIFSPVLGRTFFLPGFGASSLTEDEDDFNEELDVDVDCNGWCNLCNRNWCSFLLRRTQK